MKGMIPMNTQKTPTTPDIPSLSEHIMTVWYNDLETIDDIRNYATENDTTLSNAIASDLRDMLHNGNVEDIFDISNMTDDDVNALSSRFHDDFDQLAELSDFIATLINTTYPI